MNKQPDKRENDSGTPSRRLSLPCLDAKHVEIFIALISPIGGDLDTVYQHLEISFSRFGYKTERIKVSKGFETSDANSSSKNETQSASYTKLLQKIDQGNAVRRDTEQNAAMVPIAVAQVALARRDILQNFSKESENMAEGVANRSTIKTVFVIDQLKRPEEVYNLRKLYGRCFFAIGIHTDSETQARHLTRAGGISDDEAKLLVNRDRDESQTDTYGQQTRDTLDLADLFLPPHGDGLKHQINRFVDLLFGNPFYTPTRDEHAMYLAHASSLRSGALGRQVGAAITNRDGEIFAVGVNETPAAGGGIAWSDDTDDPRDLSRGYDANRKEMEYSLEEVLRLLHSKIKKDKGDKGEALAEIAKLQSVPDRLTEVLHKLGLTEFGREVHAEMDALLACSRKGIACDGAWLFSTTFPCHNCMKQIIRAGIARVVFVEAYPKSHAIELFGHAIGDGCGKMRLEQFRGVGPRRYMDLFSLRHSDGAELERKDANGHCIPFKPEERKFRFALDYESYKKVEMELVTGSRDTVRQVQNSKGSESSEVLNKIFDLLEEALLPEH